jgi:hypothetical protein
MPWLISASSHAQTAITLPVANICKRDRHRSQRKCDRPTFLPLN